MLGSSRLCLEIQNRAESYKHGIGPLQPHITVLIITHRFCSIGHVVAIDGEVGMKSPVTSRGFYISGELSRQVVPRLNRCSLTSTTFAAHAAHQTAGSTVGPFHTYQVM